MSHKPAGGLHSRVVKHSTNPKSEPRAYGRNPGAVGQYGALQGNHVTSTLNTTYRGEPDVRSRGYNNPIGPTDMALSGCGAGRVIHSSGSQQQWGEPARGNPPPNRQRDAAEQE